MTKTQTPTHLRSGKPINNRLDFIGTRTACGKPIRMKFIWSNQYTHLAKTITDVTCDACLRTKEYRRYTG